MTADPVLVRDAAPILTRADVPGADVSAVFNPGALRAGGRDVLVVRVQTRARETLMMTAADDGDGWRIQPEPVQIDGLPAGLYHVYDPRLTRLDGVPHMVFAADTDDGCRLGVARAADDTLARWTLLGLDTEGDRRNGVLFPERIDGRWMRLERPNRVQPSGGPPTGDAVVLAASDDLVTWREVGPVFAGRPRYWDERVGSGPPPVRIVEGWLHVYHGVATHFASAHIYQAGVVLLDLADPRRVLGRSRGNILEPRESWELTGQVPNVVFPSGMTLHGDRVTLYYGAADTVVGRATTTVGALLAACE